MKRLAIVLLVLSVLCLVGALVQFRFARTSEPPSVVLVMDCSMTMDRTDVKPSRLAAAQTAARAFLQRLPSTFKVGLVTFSRAPDVLAPPTTDHARVVAELQSPPRGNRTVMGEGLAAALDTLNLQSSSNGGTHAAVILLSDGLSTPNDSVDPLDVAARARAVGVPIYTVVLGKPRGPGGADVPLLSKIATTTGGTVSTATTANKLTTIYQTLGSRLSTELKVGKAPVLLTILAGVFGVGAFLALLGG